jgi:hypothetical protein
VRTDQEAKGLDQGLQVDQAVPQMQQPQLPSRAGQKEPTTSSAASKPRAPSTTAALMEAFTVARCPADTTARLLEIPTKVLATTFVVLPTHGRTGVVLKLVHEMNMGCCILGSVLTTGKGVGTECGHMDMDGNEGWVLRYLLSRT